MSTEVWKPVVGFEGAYEVSNLGRVRSLDRVVVSRNRWGSYTERLHSGRVLAPLINKKRGGYKYVNLQANGVQRLRRVAVLVAAAFLGPRPIGFVVCHNDGDPVNDRLENLRYDTPKNNTADIKRHGRLRVGEDNPSSRLTQDDINFIRLSRGVIPQNVVAAMVGVSQQHVSNVQIGKRWLYG